MAGRESARWAQLRAVLPADLVHQRLTDRVAEGVPDLAWTYGGVSGFTELKDADPRVTDGGVRIPWSSPAQPVWLWRWVRAGGAATCTLFVPGGVWIVWPQDAVDWVRRVRREPVFPHDPGVTVFTGAPLRALVPGVLARWATRG